MSHEVTHEVKCNRHQVSHKMIHNTSCVMRHIKRSHEVSHKLRQERSHKKLMCKTQEKCKNQVNVVYAVPLKQTCPRTLKRRVIETCTCSNGWKRRQQRKARRCQTTGYTVPKHTRLTKKARKHMMYNYGNNGNSIEQRMSKKDRQIHEELKKTTFGHTRRCIINVIHVRGNMTASKMRRKKENVQKISKGGKKVCEIREEEVKELQTESDDGNVCWLCDQIDEFGRRKIQCDKCCVWFHTTCTGMLNMKEHLISKTFTWVCCKCGHSNYCDTLFHNFGICTDENMFDMMDQCSDGPMDQMSDKKKRRRNTPNGYVKLSTAKQSLREQSGGGYLLRKRKTNSPPSNNSSEHVSDNPKTEEKTVAKKV